MGTNYYIKAPPTPWGETQHLHVGKSSVGWVFCFQEHDLEDGPGLHSVEDWRRFIDGHVAHGPCRLVDEYNEDQDPDEFWEFVARKAEAGGRHIPQARFDEGSDIGAYDFR